ncbi:MAG: hypothetical protein XD60_0823 [Acetothermia bacterium 64_32]|nr:MAG: hypothetical protein XD60_0823 [Acetothermia bacterium 64_32]HAF70671.1 hypothetical protein [Candidatus Acetothermia bacterium]
METLKEKIYRLIENAPREVLEELAEDIEDILALLAAKKEDNGRRIPWEEARRDLDIEGS